MIDFLAASLPGLVAALVLTTAVWVMSVPRRDVSIIDVFWGPGFAVLAWVYVLRAPEITPRGFLVALLVSIWGARLGWHIARRSRGHDEDYRYAAMRRKYGPKFQWLSLGLVFWLQGVLMWLISAPLLVVARSADSGWSPVDAVAGLVFATGLFFEVVGDAQLVRFKSDPSNRGQVLDSGLWRYTRHPNYFGDATLWWGLYLFAVAAGGWWTFPSPALMTLMLLKVSGVALLEKGLVKTKPRYADYVERTSAFIPWPPKPRRE